MSQSSTFTDRWSLSKEFMLALDAGLHFPHFLLHFVQAWWKERGYLVVLPTTALLFLILLFTALYASQFNPVLTFLVWFILGSTCIWLGTKLNDMSHPKQKNLQQVIETYSQAIRTGDYNILLDQASSILYHSLKLKSLSIWCYHDEESVLTLLHAEGTSPSDDLVELPLDITPEQLFGPKPVSTLPESALRQGLMMSGVQVITSLRLGDELIGIVGLGNVPDCLRNGQETFRCLDLITGQLALIVKNNCLIGELEATLRKLQLAYRRTIDAEEEERHHLAVELHDDILSRLTTMAMSLRNSQRCLTTNPARVEYWLELLREETNYLNCRLREITQGLHPTILTDLGLVPALQAYLDSLAKQLQPDSGRCTVTLTAQGFNSTRLAEQKLERDLYYITRQALDNALKHAQAEQILIHLRWREDAISLTVQDTGCGMRDTPETLMGQNGHLGLLSMNERAMSWGGRLDIQTHSGQGTTVYVHLPTDQPSEAPTLLQAFARHLASQEC